jgi:hypothetical protein
MASINYTRLEPFINDKKFGKFGKQWDKCKKRCDKCKKRCDKCRKFLLFLQFRDIFEFWKNYCFVS